MQPGCGVFPLGRINNRNGTLVPPSPPDPDKPIMSLNPNFMTDEDEIYFIYQNDPSIFTMHLDELLNVKKANSFFMFRKNERLKPEYENMKESDRSKKITVKWKNASEEIKDLFKKCATVANKRSEATNSENASISSNSSPTSLPSPFLSEELHSPKSTMDQYLSNSDIELDHNYYDQSDNHNSYTLNISSNQVSDTQQYPSTSQCDPSYPSNTSSKQIQQYNPSPQCGPFYPLNMDQYSLNSDIELLDQELDHNYYNQSDNQLIENVMILQSHSEIYPPENVMILQSHSEIYPPENVMILQPYSEIYPPENVMIDVVILQAVPVESSTQQNITQTN